MPSDATITTTTPTTDERPRVYSVPAACRALSISRTSLYELRKTGRLGFARIAGRSVIPASEMDRFVASLEAEASASRGAGQ